MEALNKKLYNAVRNGDVDLVQDCLHKGADLHYEDDHGRTPLHQAAWRGHTEVTKVLVEAGASVSAVNNEGQTPLHEAAGEGHTEVTKVLVEAGASLSAVDYDGWTPLHLAALKGHTEVTKVLLEAGASVSAVNNEGRTPLHEAAVMRHTEVTKVLLEAGASLSAVDKLGEAPLHQAAVWGNTEVIKVLVEAGASLSAENNGGRTPLHQATLMGNTEVTKVLVEAGASLSAVDKLGWTPLHLTAAEMGHTEVTKVLVEAGASLSAVDNKGRTPLHLAAEEGHTEMTKVLVEAGASLSAVDNDGKTPHNVAQDNVKKLLQKYMDKVDMSSSTDEIVEVDSQNVTDPLLQNTHVDSNARQSSDLDDNLHGNELLQQSQELINRVTVEFPMMGTSDEMKDLLSKGSFKSYENLVYLAGACNVGKSTLAGILIGEEIPKEYISTDGLNIYFGRNGINLKTREMVPLKLKQGSDGDVLSRVLCGQPGMTQAKPDTTQDCDKGTITSETHPQRKDITLSTSVVPGTGNDDVNKTDPLRGQSVQHSIIATIQEKIRKGTYEIEISPSDLVDFGGQRSFDMTHQLFMRQKGTFVLMFNGKTDIRGGLGEETTESILKHWVNSILSYCVDDDDVDEKDKDILPIILFCATHSDAFNQEDRKDRKRQLIHDLGETFKNHKLQRRIKYEDMFFINGQEETDPEINELKSKLVDVAFEQKSWGKRMPIAWVPLELQMSELRLHNMNIISKEELITLNQRNYDLALSVEQIKYFLNAQHSLGKILYFDQQGLDHFIIVQPQSLVNILRSFITAECFWPDDEELKGILETLRKTGEITKQDLLKLWSQEKFYQHMPNNYFKEFIIEVLVHLDILVEPKHYRQEKESKAQSYLVPCTVKRRLPVDDFYVKSKDKMICLSYTLLKSSIPAALSFKLIGAAINIWPLKETGGIICLYHQAAILLIDESNELHLLVKDDKVFVYLINKVNKGLIPPNIASSVQECLTLTMTKVLEFYHKSFGKSLSTSEVSKTFEIEVGEWCTSGGGCYISVLEVKEKTEWRCKKGTEHYTKYPRYWIFNKEQVKCDKKCKGLAPKDLALHPTDKHFFRLAKLISLVACSILLDKLRVPTNTWKDLKTTYANKTTHTKFFALREWRNLKYQQNSEPTFRELFAALPKKEDTHFLCQVFREDVTAYGDANRELQESPNDDVLQDVARHVGDCAIHLGLELGLEMTAIEDTLVSYQNDMKGQILDVMTKWKSSSEVKTIRMLMKAFHSAEPSGYKFLREKYRV